MDDAITLANKLIDRWEGFQSHPYRCPAGIWTIGKGTTVYPNGWRVGPLDKPISEDTADFYVRYRLGKLAVQAIADLAPCKPTAGQLGAILSLAYNAGLGIHDGNPGDLADSTLFAKLRGGDSTGACQQFLAWDKAHVNGKVVVINGLRNRRLDEQKVFTTGVFQ